MFFKMGNSQSSNEARRFFEGKQAWEGQARQFFKDWQGGADEEAAQGGEGPTAAVEQADKPVPDPLPTPPNVPRFVSPQFYAPRPSELQRATVNPQSTSHNYLARYGQAKNF